MDNNELKKHALNVRRNIIEMVYAAQSGHPGGSLGCADILTYLYFEGMNANKDNIGTINRDRFVLSKGHCSPALYGVLKEAGLLDDDIMKFRQLGSKLQGHPNMNYVDGVDMSTGSLGQGLSCAVGMAIANKLDGTDNRIYALQEALFPVRWLWDYRFDGGITAAVAEDAPNNCAELIAAAAERAGYHAARVDISRVTREQAAPMYRDKRM